MLAHCMNSISDDYLLVMIRDNSIYGIEPAVAKAVAVAVTVTVTVTVVVAIVVAVLLVVVVTAPATAPRSSSAIAKKTVNYRHFAD